MAKGFYRQIIKILRSNNCYFVREGAGDHEIWHSPITNRNVAVDKDRATPQTRYLSNAVLITKYDYPQPAPVRGMAFPKPTP